MTNFGGEISDQENKSMVQEAVREETASRPRRSRRALAFQVAVFAAIAGFAVLAWMVSASPFFALDLEITRGLQSIDSPFFAALMQWTSWAGFMPQSIFIPMIAALILYWLGLRWEAVAALVAGFMPGLVNVLVKDLIQRPRPAVDLVNVFELLDSYSFPSGHVMFYIGFFGFLWFVVFTLFKRSWKRALLLAVLAVPILLVGFSRIYLGQHWASDILGAVLLGALVLLLIIRFYLWGKKRFFIHQPAVPG